MKKKELLRRRFLHILFVLCVVSSMASEVIAQNVSKLKGVVTGDDGYPVIGANVTVKGTTVRTITDFDGNYTIEAEKNATLVFSYIGYISQEIKLNLIFKFYKYYSTALVSLLRTAWKQKG